MPFQKGNTLGRKKGVPNKATADVRLLAQKHTSEAIKVLHEIMRDKDADERARIAAAKELLDRGHGKARQSVVLTGKDGNDLPQLPPITAADIAEGLAALLEQPRETVPVQEDMPAQLPFHGEEDVVA
jgi:hypothetical protein